MTKKERTHPTSDHAIAILPVFSCLELAFDSLIARFWKGPRQIPTKSPHKRRVYESHLIGRAVCRTSLSQWPGRRRPMPPDPSVDFVIADPITMSERREMLISRRKR